MIRQPFCPQSAPHEFSTFHFLARFFSSTSTAVSVMAWVEPLSKVDMRCALSIGKLVPKSVP